MFCKRRIVIMRGALGIENESREMAIISPTASPNGAFYSLVANHSQTELCFGRVFDATFDDVLRTRRGEHFLAGKHSQRGGIWDQNGKTRRRAEFLSSLFTRRTNLSGLPSRAPDHSDRSRLGCMCLFQV